MHVSPLDSLHTMVTINMFLYYNCFFFHSDELIVLSASGTAACIDLQLATTEPSGIPHGILCMYLHYTVCTCTVLAFGWVF